MMKSQARNYDLPGDFRRPVNDETQPQSAPSNHYVINRNWLIALSGVFLLSASRSFFWAPSRQLSSGGILLRKPLLDSSSFESGVRDDFSSPKDSETSLAGRTDEKENKGEIKKPKAYVHIGPHKTGSTALQKALLNDYHIEMLKDGYISPTIEDLPGVVVRGNNKPHSNLAHCLSTACGEDGIICNPLLMNETLPTFMKKAEMADDKNDGFPNEKSNRKSIFLSSESFFSSCMNPNLLREVLKDYQVSVIAVYRPLHDLIISKHSQIAKNAYPVLPIGFLDWIQEPHRFEQIERNLGIFEDRYANQKTENGAPLFDETIVLDYVEVKRQDAGLPAVVACDVLGAKHTCEAIRNEISIENVEESSDKNSFTNVNVFQAIDYQRIVEAGWAIGVFQKRGHVHTKQALNDFEIYNPLSTSDPSALKKANDASKLLQKHRHNKADELQTWWENEQGKTLFDLPHNCIDDKTLKQIKEYSWKHYMRMKPYLLKTNQNDNKLIEFSRAEMDKQVDAQRTKYCSVDVSNVVKDPLWQEKLKQ